MTTMFAETSVLFFVLISLSLSMLLALLRMFRGPEPVDRAIAFDVFAAILIGWVAVFALWSKVAALFDILMILTFLSFLGTIAIAHFLARESDNEGEKG